MIETPPLVDQYCQGVRREELGLGTFEALLGPGGGAPAAGTTFFDTQTGFALRRWCPPLLGLAPHSPPAHYLARRRELGALETERRLLRGSGTGTYLVDTGPPLGLTPPGELAATADARAREIVRLEQLAEQTADTSGSVESFLRHLAESVHGAAATAVAFASVTPPLRRVPLLPEPPSPVEVRAAAGAWLAARQRPPGSAGPVDPAGPSPLLGAHLLWLALSSGRPLQLHTGESPPESGALAAFAAATAGLGTPLVLLPGYPYHRPAARLAGLHAHVHVDLGPALSGTGARAAGLLAEFLELAPFGKLLYSSGARGLPELHVVAARQFREALRRVLGAWVVEGAWSARDGERVAGLLGAGNARRVYGLEE
ncbi:MULTISPECIES: amidohydrolase [unclassified Streptomyces]|uniref:amidohydrolase n=1 Tax=unclassified Streptomyces TaxID=2593676 RepID=UPI0001DED9B3|nr:MULTISPECIES: amidohydrolase [unclassified Streptomyces]EFK99093.1 amidohydrolase 2 [Streptomyces sp. SPB78]MYR29378.1 amidohydrolase [Streptomyces sp. SID4945]